MTKHSSFWCALALLEMGLIWYFSSLPRPLGDFELPFKHADKLVHFVEFGVLSFLWMKTFRNYRFLKAYVISVAIALSWGFLDEGHQHFISGRDASWFDVGFDALGALLVPLMDRVMFNRE